MNNDYQALSITSHILGHHTYGKLLREYFNNSNSLGSVDFYWFKEECNKLLWLATRSFYCKFPSSWIQQRNLDFQCLRSELTTAYITKLLIKQKLHSKQYSVMHLHTQVMALLALEYMKRVPTIVSIDFTAALKYREMQDVSFQWTYAPNISLEKRVFDAASQIVTWSEFAKQSVIEDYDINENKVIVIPPGVNLSALESDNNSADKNSDNCNILFVGGDFKRKGGHDLLKVFLENFSNIAILHIVTKEAIECSHHRVRVYNNISAYTPEWKSLYQQADIFVMPTYSEGLPQVFMEAMGFSLPIIATNLPQMKEVIINDVTGFMIHPGNKNELAKMLKILVENPILRIEMGRKGKQIAQLKFDIHKNCSHLESIFKELSASQGRNIYTNIL
ncbi:MULTISPECIES: glycosyltransferase family 4 protein [unclassified Tolypothrix]|uniref:glycosyltransferase family 4 protein n=1 Tax=unclassified Tolypothrix TaxID=2649714 RepID=UPI0005EAC692|nr:MULTISPECIES: glycosyltransferase family 4 protein [unclassified Tolypothrix]BAY93091.1 group 1 glycosyl transferase [Microchaete diplosiphon NIES-3275]EKF00338.1 glycosyltransferase, group 1 family [Tolypothrix sp. PCC 7601]MBE9081888.1 glycosyltransferase family 4 protein [Tolypothrix sp. LEGE 11397]UYD26970.1 glycosyltransferase family 4 protein [Tolypothrix sp. PCC 7712]UYD37171.1 glycosyltransferase family 4 protein [Tolypothrix sp. PCC 7601]